MSAIKKYSSNGLHCHTDNSLGDGVATVQKLLDRAKALGADAVAITDHGVCAGWLDFYNYAKQIGIKPVLGVEAYVSQAEELLRLMGLTMPEEGISQSMESRARRHFILLAEDYQGMQAISRYVTESNRHMDSRKKPCGTMETLNRFFGPGYEGHGHVIGMSACIQGIPSLPLHYNFQIDREIAKVQKKIDAVEFPEGYDEAVKMVEALSQKEETVKAELTQTRALATKRYKKAEMKILKMEDSEEKGLLLANLEREKQESVDAEARMPKLQERMKSLAAQKKPYKDIVSKAKTKLGRIEELKKEIQGLEQLKRDEESIMDAARRTTTQCQQIFGEGHFYMEVQNHGLPEEAYIYPRLAQIAREEKIPLVATNDVHMAEKTDTHLRTMIENMAYLTTAKEWKPARPGDEELYYKSGDELAAKLAEILPEDMVEEAMANIDAVCGKCNLELSKEKHYPKFENAKDRLRKLCDEGIPKRYPDGFPDSYRKQMEYELGIIDQMGFNDYFVEVAEFINFAKESADNSIEIGPGRGSGAGSIVCYLSGITELDPMKYGLMFERFLNPERVSMPDIDTDFSGHAREISIVHVKELYGERNVASIMTKNRMAPKSALDYAGKMYGLERYQDKGRFTPLVKSMKALVGNKPGVTLSDCGDAIRTEFAANEEALTILAQAYELEGITTSFGTHAAGVIIGDGRDLENFIPLILTKDDDGNDAWAIQADMVQAEAQLGFIKMDFLGLKNLNIITDAMRMITNNYGITIDPYDLPFEREVFENIYQTGDTNFVFQFESDGMKGMLKDFKPDCFEDIILLVAAYRPGPMQYLPDVIAVKNGKKPATYLVPELEPILKDTYGAVIYQEQVIKICTNLAGFSMAQADNVRRFMSKKKADKLAHEKDAFIHGDAERNIPGCVANGIPADKAETLFEQLMDFAKYAFNKSHAAAYALVSYQTAWLKYHYFKEYVCAAIKTQDDKTVQLSEDCKKHGVEISRPDINESDEFFRTEGDSRIIFGLSSIKGLKSAAAPIIAERKENGPFTSPEHFVTRVRPDKRTLDAVVLSGAMDAYTDNREALLEYLSRFSEAVSAHAKAVEKLNETQTDEKKRKAAETAVEDAAKAVLAVTMPKHAELSVTDRLSHEMDLLGMWVTGNPLDDYDLSTYTDVGSITDGAASRVAGVVTGYRKVNRKSDGAPMAFFSLVGRDGSTIPVCCFTRQYKKYGSLLGEGVIIAISGKVETDGEGQSLIIESVTVPEKNKKVILFKCRDVVEKAEMLPMLEAYKKEDGCMFRFYDETFKQFQDGKFLVSEEILERDAIRAEYMPA
jgi:DNA polymerase-3 subunit alpha